MYFDCNVGWKKHCGMGRGKKGDMFTAMSSTGRSKRERTPQG